MNSLIILLKEYTNVIKTVVQWYMYHLMFCCDSIITSEKKSQPMYNNQVFLYVSEAHMLIILVLVGLGLG